MPTRLESLLLSLASRGRAKSEPHPLLIELLEKPRLHTEINYDAFPFAYAISNYRGYQFYHIYHLLPPEMVQLLRAVTEKVTEDFAPGLVEPLTFDRLIAVMTELAAERLGASQAGEKMNELSELVTYEAIGLPTVLALAKDEKITEFFVDSETSPLYVDHIEAGRCDTAMMFTERERQALQTHADTFSGYTLDYRTPSLKNDLQVSGARLRITIDLEPTAVNKFSLDVRRLNISSMKMSQLITLNVVSGEVAGLLIAWLTSGGNITIIGETGTGKTTLLNAIDEEVEPKLRRLYIEDAVETLDLLDRGFHQMKVKVDPFERVEGVIRTKESEIVKALHRSPDLVILSEIQSQDHSKAFFHALSAGAKGIQTFHATTIEQAVRRWTNVHGVPEQSLLDLGLLVQMTRPDRLKAGRFVSRVCQVVSDEGAPRIRELFVRDRDFRLRLVADLDSIVPPPGVESKEFVRRLSENATWRTGEGNQ